MGKTVFFILFVLTSFLINAQTSNHPFKGEISVKVKVVKSIANEEFCKTQNYPKDEAVVMEFEVVNQIDIEKFGNKIYAITICDDFPGDGAFNSKAIHDLELSEFQYFCWNIKIFNEKLLDKNLNKEKFWIRELSRRVTAYCGYGNK